MENRIHYLDTVKGIAIVLMVIGHAIAKCLKGTSAVISVVVPEAPINILVASGIGNIIYTFHMGLFFFVSGYLLRGNCFLGGFCVERASVC